MTAQTEPPIEQSHAETDSQHEADEEEDEFGKDDVFHLLQNERRRRVLKCLRGEEETVEMGDVAEQVAAWEHDTTVQALTSDQRQRVYIALYQAHLPKLDEAGVIEYNQSRGYVTPTERADRLAGYLDLPDEKENEDESSGTKADDPLDFDSEWANYHVAATGIGAALLALSTFEVSAFAALSPLGVGLSIVAMFGVLSLGLLYKQRRATACDD